MAFGLAAILWRSTRVPSSICIDPILAAGKEFKSAIVTPTSDGGSSDAQRWRMYAAHALVSAVILCNGNLV
jgi:hypothetical protein